MKSGKKRGKLYAYYEASTISFWRRYWKFPLSAAATSSAIPPPIAPPATAKSPSCQSATATAFPARCQTSASFSFITAGKLPKPESSDAFPWTTSFATLPKWKTCMSATWLLSSTNFTLLTTSAATPAPSDMKCCPESAKTDALNAATSDRKPRTGSWCALFRRQNPG